MPLTADSRVYQNDLNAFLQTSSKHTVKLFIREVSGTHYTRMYIILIVLKKEGDFTWVHELFSNFSTDWKGREASMKIAARDLIVVHSVLEKNGYQVLNGMGQDYHTWKPTEVHLTRHYHYEEEEE